MKGEQVLSALPGSLPAQQELLGLVLENIQQHHADKFLVSNNEVVSKIIIKVTSLMILQLILLS